MYDDHRVAPDRGPSRDARQHRREDYDDRPDAHYRSRQGTVVYGLSLTANFLTDRRGFSRSPPRQDSHSVSPDQEAQDMPYDNSRHSRYGGPGDASSRRNGDFRSSRRYPEDNHDYGGMYDERPPSSRDMRNARYGDDGSREDYRSSRERRHRTTHSPSADQRVRSRSHSRTREAGSPTDTVILEGLPFGPSAVELQDSILNSSSAADFPGVDVRVSASRGNRRAFIQFEHIDHAIAFMKAHFPKVYVELEHPTDDAPEGHFAAYVHYARSREEGEIRSSNTNANWNCPTCDFSNYSTRSVCKICGTSQSGVNWRESLTGAADAADVPSQILVVYPLAPFVDEEMLARDLQRLELRKPEAPKNTGGDAPKLKSTAPTNDASGYGARPGSLHRVFLMRDTESNESFKYGFVEFWTMEDAAAAMTKFKMSRSFTVAACAVTLSTIHMGVFVPESRPATPATEHISFRPLFNPSILVKYRDPHAYPSQLIVASEPPVALDTGKKPEDDSNESKKPKKRKADASLTGALPKKSVPMAGQMAMWQKKHDELMGAPNSSNQDDKSQDRKDNEQIQGKTVGKAFEQKGPIKISLSSSKIGAPTTPSDTTSGVAKVEAAESADASKAVANEAQDSPAEKVELYIDRDELTCLICRFRYKNLEEVGIHEKSRRHRAAMEDPELVKKALPRIAKRDERMRAEAEAEEADKTQYRDRAKERRQAFNQPKKQAQPSKPKSDTKAVKQDAAAAPSKPAAPSKGAGMLAKMGWTAGAGLGANGEGRTEVVETNAYQEGVGLGAEGGNLGDAAQRAERRTKSSYADYVNEVQDKARERYNRME